jgi:hypothetical protein
MPNGRWCLPPPRWEQHLDGEPAPGPGYRAQVGAVRGGDRADDGQPQAQPAGRPAGGIHPLERLEQPAELIGRDDRPGVGHGEVRAARPGAGADLHPAARRVVPDRVVDQVGHQAFGESGVPGSLGGLDAGGQGELRVVRVVLARGQHVNRDRGQVERLEPVQAALAAGQREQAGDEPFLLLARCQRPFAGRSERGVARLAVAQRDLEQGPLPRQRRAQLVRGVRDELALRPERGVQPAEQLIEGVAQLLELVVGTGHRDPLVQAAGREAARGGGDRAQRAEYPPGHQPAQSHRPHGHDGERDPGLDEQLVQRVAAHPDRHRLQQGLAGAAHLHGLRRQHGRRRVAGRRDARAYSLAGDGDHAAVGRDLR